MQLQANQSVWVWVLESGEDGPVGAGVVTSVAKDRIGIRFPELRGLLPGCDPDSSVVLRVVADQGAFVAQTTVLRVQTTPQVMILVRPPESFSTVQRRKFFRVAARLPVVCTITASAQPDAVGLSDADAKTQNISAGGLSLLTELALQVGDEVSLGVSIPKLRSAAGVIELAGSVVRVGPGESKPRVTLAAGVRFAHKDQQQEDALVRIMFDLQRRSLG